MYYARCEDLALDQYKAQLAARNRCLILLAHIYAIISSLNMISKAQVREVFGQLKELIERRERKLRATVETFNCWRDMDEILSGLRSAIKKMRLVIAAEQREVQAMKHKLQDLALVREIDPSNPSSEKQLLSFVESQSIVAGPSDAESPTEGIGLYFEKMQKFLSRRLSGQRTAKECTGREQGSQASPSSLKAAKCQAADCKFSSKAFTEALVILAEEKDVCGRDLAKNYYLYKENANRGKYLIANERSINKEHKNYTHSVKESCLSCKQYTSHLLKLSCCGKICTACLKKRIIEKEPKVILNAFEAERKQKGMFVCPTHNVPLSFELLQGLFGPRELARLSVDAVRRQKKMGTSRKVKQPTVCAECGGVMRDDGRAAKVCALHKMCGDCAV